VAQVAVPAALLGMDVVAGGVVAGAGAVSALLALAVWENSYGLDKDPVRSRGLNAAFVGGWVSGVVAPLVAVPVGLVVAVVGALTLYASHGGTLPKLPVGEATEDRPSGRRGREQW
jgi:ABC-type phosphate transport system permease subunit